MYRIMEVSVVVPYHQSSSYKRDQYSLKNGHGHQALLKDKDLQSMNAEET